MPILNVELGRRSYPIYIGKELLSSAEILDRHIRGTQVMVVSNETVAPLYLDAMIAALSGFDVHTKVLPDGEQHKNMATLNSIFDAMMAIPCDRRTTVVALGGGVVGDIAGFAAACYQRGIPLIQVPTTLLAQVDSSVGGKTAVNHPLGKNMVGTFYQPTAVIADIETLHTLPDREVRAGLAEIIKYGLIGDHEFFTWLEENIERLLQLDDDCLSFAIERSCRNKAQVVAADERERGERALLNLGHTFQCRRLCWSRPAVAGVGDCGPGPLVGLRHFGAGRLASCPRGASAVGPIRRWRRLDPRQRTFRRRASGNGVSP